MLESWKDCARRLKTLVSALHIAYRDPRTPLLARIVAVCVVAYALSPIDLIPDPIPILGYLDDLILLPLGIALAVKLMPDAVWSDAQERARRELESGQPVNWMAASIIVALWVVLAIAAVFAYRRWTL